ncbi:MAG: hypothetical protein C6H99_01995 [Epsilonproteobacteria bacterium]|nr:hypothetical protein [Campylobacterota bacterium]NPA63854.1 type II secretion system protein [Campylobacterota bacterium]
MKRGLSIVELIVVLAILAILASAMLYGFKPRTLQNDANFLLLHIDRTRYEGLAYDPRGAEMICIDLDAQGIEDLATQEGYRLKSKITKDFDTLCFDAFGQPYQKRGGSMMKIVEKKELIELQKGSKKASIWLYPKSGYVIISYQ